MKNPKLRQTIKDVIQQEFAQTPAVRAATRLWRTGVRANDITDHFNLAFPTDVHGAHLSNVYNALRDLETGACPSPKD